MATTTNESNLYKSKTEDDIPENIKAKAKMLMVNKFNGDIHLIGSFSYASIIHSSDVDMIEIIDGTDRDAIIHHFVRSLQNVVSDVLKTPDIFFMEVKMGLDQRYNVRIGRCHAEVFTVDPYFRDNVKRLHEFKLLSDGEYLYLCNLSMGTNQIHYELIHATMRAHHVIRWSADEIKTGFKILTGNKKMTLEEAAGFRIFANLECIFKDTNEIYKEISNYFVVQYQDADIDNTVAVNLEPRDIHNIPDYLRESMSKSIEKVYYSKLDRSLLKLCKRYFSFARMFGYTDLLRMSAAILNTDIGHLGSLNAMLKCIKKLNNKYNIDMSHQVQYVRQTLEKIEFPDKLNILTELNNNNIGSAIKLLADTIDGALSVYLKFHNLIPPPAYTLPINREF